MDWKFRVDFDTTGAPLHLCVGELEVMLDQVSVEQETSARRLINDLASALQVDIRSDVKGKVRQHIETYRPLHWAALVLCKASIDNRRENASVSFSTIQVIGKSTID
eukprot:gene2621-3013_t